jgi:hypothetical protein
MPVSHLKKSAFFFVIWCSLPLTLWVLLGVLIMKVPVGHLSTFLYDHFYEADLPEIIYK